MPNAPIINCAAIKAGVDSGTWAVDTIKINNVPNFCDSAGGSWALSQDATKDKMHKYVFDLIKAGSLNQDGSITTSRGRERLISDDGFAKLVPA